MISATNSLLRSHSWPKLSLCLKPIFIFQCSLYIYACLSLPLLRGLLLIANRTRSGENLKQFKGKIGYLKVICTFLITKTEARQSFYLNFSSWATQITPAPSWKQNKYISNNKITNWNPFNCSLELKHPISCGFQCVL